MKPNLKARPRGCAWIPAAWALASALLIAPPAPAQLLEEYRFRGTVVDTEDRPIARVTITFEDLDTGARIAFRTHDDGTFDRRMIPSGDYEVTFAATGYARRVEHFDWSVQPTAPVVKEARIVLESLEARAERELGGKAAKLYREAYEALQSGDCDRARKKAQELLGVGAGDWEYAVRFVLARCAAMTGNLDEAAAEYAKVIALKPGLFEAHYDFASVLEKQEKHAEAVAEYEKAAELNPEDAEVRYNAGAILFRQKQFDRAIPHLAAAVELAPGHAQAHKALGLAHLQGKTKNPAAARQHLARYLRLEPNAKDAAQVREIVDSLPEPPAKKAPAGKSP